MSRAAPDASYRGKRAFDLAVVALAAVPAALLGLVSALAVRLSSPGPVIFRQERVGLDGAPFEALKFRTMRLQDEGGTYFPDDERITGVGRWLRRLSLDELPQLVNVARGDMSVVGPRPTLAYQVERYTERQRGRLAVRPGLTGLAQVTGRNAMYWAERIELDLEYIATQSIRVDVRLLFRSLATVFSGEGIEGHPTDDPIAMIETDEADG